MAYARNRQQSWGNSARNSNPSQAKSQSSSNAMLSGRFLLQVPKSLPSGSMCPLCQVPIGRGHIYQAHIGSVQHAETYLKEMSMHGPAYFYQMFDNVPFPDPVGAGAQGWSASKETDPFMVYAVRCGVYCGYKCKGCVKQCGSMEKFREHILCKEHLQRTSFRISDIGEDKYREIHFDVPSWPQEKLFQGRTSSVFERETEQPATGLSEDESYGLGPLRKSSQDGGGEPQSDMWSDGSRKRGHSPERFTDKRFRDQEDSLGEYRQASSSEDKQSDITSQLQQMLKQLARAQGSSNQDDYGSSGQSHMGSSENTLLNEMTRLAGKSKEKPRKERWGPPSQMQMGSEQQADPVHFDTVSGAAVSQQKTGQQLEEKVLYISGLPTDFDRKALNALCSPFGKVIEARIYNQENRARNDIQGFVEMASRRECLKIIQAFNGQSMPGCNTPLVVKFANKKKGGRDGGSSSQQYATAQQQSKGQGNDYQNLLEMARRREEELRKEVQRKEEELRKDTERLEIERKEAELRKKMEQLEEERRLLAREREQGKIQREQERSQPDKLRDHLQSSDLQSLSRDQEHLSSGLMNENEIYEAQLREAQLREIEIRNQMREADVRKVHLREAQMNEREALETELRARGLNELEIRQMMMQQEEALEREMQMRQRDQRGYPNEGQYPPSLLDLPIKPPGSMPAETPQLEMRQIVLEMLSQLESMGVQDIGMLPRLLDVVGELNQATLRVLGDMEPAMLERFCVIDAEMLMQLASTMPELRHLVEQVNLPVLITLLRAIGPQAVQTLAQAFADNPELFVCMRGIVQNMIGGQAMGDDGLPSMGDGILPVPHEPLGDSAARRLEMLQEQLEQNTTKDWPPKPRD